MRCCQELFVFKAVLELGVGGAFSYLPVIFLVRQSTEVNSANRPISLRRISKPVHNEFHRPFGR